MTAATTTQAPAKPRLLSDLTGGQRTAIVVAVAVGAVVLAHIARYDYAAIYYNLLETSAVVTAHYHTLIPDPVYRHAGRFAIEGLYAGASVQIVLYNWAHSLNKDTCLPKPAKWWHRYVFRFLLIPTDRLPGQTLWCLTLSWLWMIVFAAPFFLLGLWVLTITHTLPTTVTTLNLPVWLKTETSLVTGWQFPVLGALCSVLGARPVIKGTAYHTQRLIIRDRLTRGLRTPAWWMAVFPYLRWRFEWEAERFDFSTVNLRSPKHVLHLAVGACVLALFAALTYQGWHILTYLDFSFTHPFLLR